MAKERKIRCDCGSILKEQITAFNHIRTEALVCPSCHYTTLTLNQAKKYMRLKFLHEILDKERKIIKIGNSIGITFPDQLKEYGMKAGKIVRLEALSPTSFKIELKN